MRELNEYLKLDKKNKKGKGRFKIIEFLDNGYFITYVPSLNVSSYGSTKAESREMMSDVVLKDFFENILSLPEHQIFSELKKLGWERSAMFTKELSKSAHVDREGVLKNFNLSEETVLEETLVEA